MKRKKRIQTIVYHVLVCFFGFIMLYPLLWMVMSSFKEKSTIFTTARSLLPQVFTFENYVNGWRGFGGISFATFFKNSFIITVLSTLGSTISSALVGYSFSRFRYRGKKVLFAAMLVSMMLPGQILMVPQYLWYQKLGWVGSFRPLIIPFWFATQGFFVYLISTFISGIPRELDEAAMIDGCSYFGIFTRIILPLSVPALITSTLFSFMWRWDDVMGPLLYSGSPEQYPVSLALKLFADPGSSSDFGALFAMGTLSLIPMFLIFIFFQKYLVEGIASSGLKG